jgi:hypothetical protein
MTAVAPTWSLQPLAGAIRQRWANGGGETQELLAWPPRDAPGPWHLRVSVAQVDAPGPFSTLPGVQRWMVALSGGAVMLSWPHAVDPIPFGPGQPPQVFDGAEAPTVAVVGATPARLLNFMVRADQGQGRLEPVRRGAPAPAAPWRALFSETGLWLHTPAGPLGLPPSTLAWQAAGADAAPCTLREAAGPAWWLAWWPRGASNP